jgi:hypothetical protein
MELFRRIFQSKKIDKLTDDRIRALVETGDVYLLAADHALHGVLGTACPTWWLLLMVGTKAEQSRWHALSLVGGMALATHTLGSKDGHAQANIRCRAEELLTTRLGLGYRGALSNA